MPAPQQPNSLRQLVYSQPKGLIPRIVTLGFNDTSEHTEVCLQPFSPHATHSWLKSRTLVPFALHSTCGSRSWSDPACSCHRFSSEDPAWGDWCLPDFHSRSHSMAQHTLLYILLFPYHEERWSVLHFPNKPGVSWGKTRQFIYKDCQPDKFF